MKSTGVVRRIDELGRIVIPKEIRNNLNIREGESLEIFVDNNSLIMQKFSKIYSMQDTLNVIIKYISESFNININLYDRDKLLLYTSEELGKLLFIKEFNDMISTRKDMIFDVTIDNNIHKIYSKPLIISSDVIGILVLEINDNLEEIMKVANFLNSIIVKKINI
ncbi:MAG: AbrB/MazE/SpoVT family DNA-binding domain-containing protein [Firmicutes bacterium]|nr:AbrB/MazE/SpoVT family DNA-binding domain-containing protein [Bacillota bacterium]